MAPSPPTASKMVCLTKMLWGFRKMFRDYLETYAVKRVILSPKLPFPIQYRTLLRVRAKLPGAAICETTQNASYFQRGKGRVSASTNRIGVRDTDPNQTIVLRYHWLETLSCKPNCRILRAAIPHDAVGFIQVPAPHPKNFTIYNSYVFQ